MIKIKCPYCKSSEDISYTGNPSIFSCGMCWKSWTQQDALSLKIQETLQEVCLIAKWILFFVISMAVTYFWRI